MKIVHVAPFYYPVTGGVERVVERIAEHMAFKGADVCVLTYNRSRLGGLGSLPPEEHVNGVRVIRLKPSIVWSHGSYSSELPTILRELRPDIVHVHVWRHPHVFQVAGMKRKLRFKAVLHPHAPFHKLSQLGIVTWFYHRIADLLLKSALKAYDAIIALTPYEKEVLVKNLEVDEGRINVIPNGLDEELFLAGEGDVEDPEKKVLYVGRISRSKNVDLLVKAMAYVQKHVSAKLLLAGPDEGLVNRLKALSAKCGVDMRYLGQIKWNNLKHLYKRSTVLGHPTSYEAFGITLLEAQAFGKPCVITGYGGQLYVAPPNVTSLHARPNPRDFGEKILTLLVDDNLRRRLGSNARRWASRFLWSKILPQYEKLYSQLCE